jgi:hypothetical protein
MKYELGNYLIVVIATMRSRFAPSVTSSVSPLDPRERVP